MKTEQAIEEILRISPSLQQECRQAQLLPDPHQLMSPSEFVSRLFGFSPDWLEECEDDPQILRLREVLAEADKALLRHIQVAVSPEATFLSGGAFRLRCSHVFSPAKVTKGGTPLSYRRRLSERIKSCRGAHTPLSATT